MKINMNITLDVTEGELGELMALAVLGKEYVTFESEVEILDRLCGVFAKAKGGEPLVLDIKDFVVLAKATTIAREGASETFCLNPVVYRVTTFLEENEFSI